MSKTVDYLHAARTKTKGGIPFRLMPGTTMESDGDREIKATEIYLMRVSDLGAFHAESFPPARLQTPIGTMAPFRRHMPGAPFLLTKRLTVKSQADDLPVDPLAAWHPNNGSLAFSIAEHDKTFDDLCLVTIEYETTTHDVDADPSDPITFLERSMTAGGRFLQIPPHNTQFRNDDVFGKSDDIVPSSGGSTAANAIRDNPDQQQSISLVQPTVEHNLKLRRVTKLNFDNINANLGRVNSRTARVLYDAPPETCLFAGYSARQSVEWDGASTITRPWEIDFRFSQAMTIDKGRTYGWNHAYQPHRGRWVRIFRRGQTALYETFDIDQFFSG